MPQQVVGAAQVQDAANKLDDLKTQALDVLDRYLRHATDLQASGGLDGKGGQASVVTAEEIQRAQHNVNMKWEAIISALRGSAPDFVNTDEQSASHIGSIAGGLRYV